LPAERHRRATPRLFQRVPAISRSNGGTGEGKRLAIPVFGFAKTLLRAPQIAEPVEHADLLSTGLRGGDLRHGLFSLVQPPCVHIEREQIQVRLRLGATFGVWKAGAPRKLFRCSPARTFGWTAATEYDVSKDGSQFVLSQGRMLSIGFSVRLER
jgi:hypothetical protein